MRAYPSPTGLPFRAGVGLKPEHFKRILAEQPDVGFFEIHAENYLGAGGPPHRYLSAIRALYPLSIHGVGLSIGGSTPLDAHHLGRIAELCNRYEPAAFSEHLAWSTHEGAYLNDLLPLPYTAETLALVCDHVDQVQAALQRQILIENPSSYVRFAREDISEVAFLGELARRTGCLLLLDVNNVQVSCTNVESSATEWLAQFPYEYVAEIHLAGHDRRSDGAQRPLLIDTHDRRIAPEVWELYTQALKSTGPVPALIEWDAQVPDLTVLMAEAHEADRILYSVTGDRRRAVV